MYILWCVYKMHAYIPSLEIKFNGNIPQNICAIYISVKILQKQNIRMAKKKHVWSHRLDPKTVYKHNKKRQQQQKSMGNIR